MKPIPSFAKILFWPRRAAFVFSSRAARHLAGAAFGALMLCAAAGNAAGATCTVSGAGGAQFTTIQAAVNDATCTQINVAAGTYNEHVTIARDVTISGAGAASTIVDGTNSGRVFTINSGIVVLNDLTVQHGKTDDGAPGFDCNNMFNCLSIGQDSGPGAGILNAGSLTVLRVIVRENHTGKGGDGGNLDCPYAGSQCQSQGGFGGDGAAISSTGSVTVSASTFLSNATGSGGAAASTVTCDPMAICHTTAGKAGNGGAIVPGSGGCTIAASSFSNNAAYDGGAINQSNAVLTISDSQFTGNSSTDAGGAVNCNSGQSCTIQGSTFASNSVAGVYGGGAISFFNGGTKTVTNCTIANNNSTSAGGGIYARSGPVSLNFVTIVGNHSDSDNNGNGDGGGLNNSGAALNVKNSLIATNTKGTSTAQNCAGGITDGGFNLDSAATCGFTAATSQSNTNPLLDPAGLADHGGPTQTIALQATSPAIDKANSAGGPALDQRGFLRSGPADTGAFEFNGKNPKPTIVFVAHATAGPFVLQARGVPNISYTIQATSALGSPFGFIGTATADGTGLLQYSDPSAAGQGQRFYRATYP